MIGEFGIKSPREPTPDRERTLVAETATNPMFFTRRRRVAGYAAPRGGRTYKRPPPALPGKSFAHEYALVSSLGAAPYLLVADGGIETPILGHRPVRIEAEFAIAAPQRFGLGKGQQPTAQSRTLPRRGDGDIVEEQMIRPGQQDDDTGYRGPFLDHPNDTLGDARTVVVEHRPRRFSDAGNVMPISLLDDLPDRRHIGGVCGSDTRLEAHLGCLRVRPSTTRTFRGAASQIARIETALHPAAIQNA